jgi:hypothetical protein
LRLPNPYVILFSFFYLIILSSTDIAQSHVNPDQAFHFGSGLDPDANLQFNADPGPAFLLLSGSLSGFNDDVDPRGSRFEIIMRIQSKNVKKMVFEDVLIDLI